MARQPAPRHRRSGRREDDRDDEQRADRKQQQVLQLETVKVFLGGRDEISNRGELDRGWFPTGQEVQQDGDSRARQSREGPRMEEFDHAAREDVESAPRSTNPYGVSVVM